LDVGYSDDGADARDISGRGDCKILLERRETGIVRADLEALIVEKNLVDALAAVRCEDDHHVQILVVIPELGEMDDGPPDAGAAIDDFPWRDGIARGGREALQRTFRKQRSDPAEDKPGARLDHEADQGRRKASRGDLQDHARSDQRSAADCFENTLGQFVKVGLMNWAAYRRWKASFFPFPGKALLGTDLRMLSLRRVVQSVD